MKSLKTLLAALLLCCTLISCAVFASADSYTYTVRIFPGNQASSVNGSAVYVQEGMAPGSRIEFDSSWVTPDNDKYYVMGIREAGKDNTTYAFSFAVTRDQDYVVAYGVKGETVAYTVRYVDTAGNSLRDSESFNGYAGRRHVVAYRYIDGYQPQAYNLVKTLDANPENNVFTFVYSRIVTPTPTPSPSPSTAPGGTGTATGGEQNPETGNVGENPGTQGGDTPTAEPQPEPTQENENPQHTDSPEPEASAAPEEILDLDLPLSEYEGQENGKGLPLVLRIVILLALLGLLALIVYLLLGRRKKRNGAET